MDNVVIIFYQDVRIAINKSIFNSGNFRNVYQGSILPHSRIVKDGDLKLRVNDHVVLKVFKKEYKDKG